MSLFFGVFFGLELCFLSDTAAQRGMRAQLLSWTGHIQA